MNNRMFALLLLALWFGALSFQLSAQAQPHRFLPSPPRRPVDNSEENSATSKIIKEMGSTARGQRGKLVPALLRAMSDADVESARRWTFLGNDYQDPSVVSALVGQLTGQHAMQAAAVLAGMNPEFGAHDINPLLTAAKSSNASVRQDIATLLASAYKCNDARVKTALIALLLKDSDPKVRSNAAYALGGVGRDEYFKNSESTARALADSLQHDSSADVRQFSCIGLSFMGAKAAGASKALAAALRDNDQKVRFGAMEAIAKIGRPCKEAIPDLIALLNAPDERMGMGSSRYYACAALGQMGPAAADAIDPLKQMVSSGNNAREAARALGGIGPKAASAIPLLIKLLDSPNYDDREAAAKGLAGMGNAAASALPALEKAAKDDRNEQRCGNPNMAKMLAREAITKISGH